MRRRRSGFTLIELLVVVAIIALLIAILLPSLARARELAKRTACAANVSGMGKGLYTYATENADIYPIAAPNSAGRTPTAVPVTYYNMTGRNGTVDPASITNAAQYLQELSTTRNLWQLVKSGGTSPRSFICPSSSDSADTVDSPADYWDFPAIAGNMAVDRGWASGSPENENCVSYGYQVPYGTYGKPTTEVDQRMALAADKGPYGAKNGSIQAEPASNLTVQQAQNMSPDEWMQYNSNNHGGQGAGEGQVVLYADTHAEFQSKPIVGVGFDNIYTAWIPNANPAVEAATRCAGYKPSTSRTQLLPAKNTDSLIYP